MMSELFSVRSGRGRPIVVIHGGLGLDHTYMRALDRLGDVAELIYIDVRGNGRSARSGLESLTLASITDEIDALRAELGFERWIVLGHSFGSFIALTYALRHPDRVAALVAIASAHSFEHVSAVMEHVGERGHPGAAAALVAALGEAPVDDAQFAEIWAQVLPLYFHAWTPRHLAAFAGSRYSAAGYKAGHALLATYNVRAELERIAAPTLVIAGADDFLTPADLCSSVLSKGIPQAQLSVIPAAGHFPFLESPVAFDAELRAWLTAASRT